MEGRSGVEARSAWTKGKDGLTETRESFTGGFSVVCHTETLACMGDLKTLTVLTYDAEEKTYKFYEFNSVGWSNSAKGTFDGGTWIFDGEARLGGKLVRSRSTIKLVSPDSATLKSEMSIDGGRWTLVMDLKGNRVNQSQPDLNSCVPHASEGWQFELFECYRKFVELALTFGNPVEEPQCSSSEQSSELC